MIYIFNSSACCTPLYIILLCCNACSPSGSRHTGQQTHFTLPNPKDQIESGWAMADLYSTPVPRSCLGSYPTHEVNVVSPASNSPWSSHSGAFWSHQRYAVTIIIIYLAAEMLLILITLYTLSPSNVEPTVFLIQKPLSMLSYLLD